ncbi:MAG: hypothetical protein AB7S26_25945 [Sandaracinaceae bacterium]
MRRSSTTPAFLGALSLWLLALSMASVGSGCTVIVEDTLANKGGGTDSGAPDAGGMQVPCTSDRQCVTLDPMMGCNFACVAGFCERTQTPDGTACGAAGGRICVDGFCDVSRCGDGYVDRAATPHEFCDDGNANEMDGCTSMCTRACGTGLPNCDDMDSCGMETCMAVGGMMLCRAMDAMADGAPCTSRTVTDGVCRNGLCIAAP